MHASRIALLSSILLAACGDPAAGSALGVLSLSLSAQAGGETYRLTTGAFRLEGPHAQTLPVEGEDPIALSLPVGSYTLALQEGWALARTDDEVMTPVPAALVSQNPAPFVIGPGATTFVMLRFALADRTPLEMTAGKLEVGITLDDGPPDATGTGTDGCTQGLLVNEIDYDQDGPDDVEFVELVNAGACTARLADVTLELVNGGDGGVYARVPLARAGEGLGAGARLVVGHPRVLAALPESVLRVALGSGSLQNGAPDAVRLVEGARLLDVISYEGSVDGAVEGGGATGDDGPGSLSRCPDSFDSQDNSVDVRPVAPTPGVRNACG